MSVSVSLPIHTVSESNSRGHWSKRAKRARQQRSTVALVLRVHLRSSNIALPVSALLTRVAPSTGLDDDNLRAALKAVRDGVADALGLDDRDPSVTWLYSQRRGAPKQYAVEISISNDEAA